MLPICTHSVRRLWDGVHETWHALYLVFDAVVDSLSTFIPGQAHMQTRITYANAVTLKATVFVCDIINPTYWWIMDDRPHQCGCYLVLGVCHGIIEKIGRAVES